MAPIPFHVRTIVWCGVPDYVVVLLSRLKHDKLPRRLGGLRLALPIDLQRIVRLRCPVPFLAERAAIPRSDAGVHQERRSERSKHDRVLVGMAVADIAKLR